MSAEQQLIDLAISNFLQTNDATARQYQMHRRSAVEISQQVKQEMEASGEVSAATKQRFQQLQYDNMKMNVQYKAHVEKLQRNMGVFEQGSIAGLDGQISEISRKNDAILKETDKLAKTHKPVVEKLAQLVQSFQKAVSIKGSRASRSKAAGESETLLRADASVFSREELEELLADVGTSLANLKTVDEITEEGGEGAGDGKSSIDVAKHLGELLQNSRAYTRLDDGRYKYDISKSSSVDIGNGGMSLEEYGRAISVLVGDIQDLVVRGTEAKERWVVNARKIEAMQFLLDDAMDTEP